MTSTQSFWNTLTDLILVIALALAAVFALTALVQWISRKSFRKIDRELRWALVPCALLTLAYVIFEKFWVLNLRPNGSGEPSFPSTHTMLVATIFFLTIILLPRYVKSRRTRLILDAIMLIAIILVAVGRVLANMHWPSDVLGGLIFAGIFAIIYNLILRRPENAPTIGQSTSKQPNPTKHHPQRQNPSKASKPSSPEIIQPDSTH